MKKEQINSLIRHILSIIGGILLSKGMIDETTFNLIIGTLLSVVAVAWSIKEKTYTLGQIEGTIRQVLTVLSGFIAFKGYLSPSNIELWVGAIITLLPIILGQTDKLWSANSQPVSEALK